MRHRGRVGYSQRAGAKNSEMCLSLGSKGWYTKIKGWESGGQKQCGIQDCVEENVMHQPTPHPPISVCVFFSSCQSLPTSHYAILSML